jgi:tight adherence protein B
MIIAVLTAALVVLFAAPAARRLRPALRPRPSEYERDRHPREATSDCASVLDAIARQVRSGSTLTGAIIDEVGGLAPFDALVDRLAAGSSLTQALATIEPNDPDLALTTQALSATAHLGGPIAATLDEAAAVLRERAAARAERRVQAAQAILSARVLTIVPLGFAGWSAIAGQRIRDVYLSTAGGICALCGLTLNLAGWRWMKKIVGPS